MQIELAYFWRNIFFLGLGTLFIRASIIFLSSKIKISNRLREILSFIPASILPALFMPLVFFHKGEVEALLGKERLIILFIAAIISYKSRSMILTILCGMLLLYFTNFF